MRTVSLLILVVLLTGCGKEKTEAASADAGAPAAAKTEEGVVSIPADSPKLKEIHVGEVKSASVPFDEVVSPGKIETNPNLVSRVALPLAGRISSVLVKLGDSVKRGDPLLTLESPDADAAAGACLQAQAAVTQAKAAVTQAKANLNK